MNHLAQLVKNTYTKYNINFEKNIIFTNEEHKFRVSCLKEEWNEYLESIAREDSLDALVDLLYFVFGTIERQVGIENFIFKEVYTDALINDIINKYSETKDIYLMNDLIYAIYSLVLFNHFGDIFEEAFKRVNEANMKKEIGTLQKRGSFQLDLIKPMGWKSPILIDLLEAQ